MLLNDDLTYEEKAKRLVALGKEHGAASSLVNSLFFAARNGAIAHLLRSIEHEFLGHKMLVVAAWKESSVGGPTIELTLTDNRSSQHVRRIQVDREVLGHALNVPSTLAYKLNAIHAGDYYAGRKPKSAEAFDQVLSSPAFKKKVDTWVNGANYPFTYETRSSF